MDHGKVKTLGHFYRAGFISARALKMERKKTRFHETLPESDTEGGPPVLEIERVDLKCTVNNVEHHTALNGTDRLIVRRGQPFTITLYLKDGSRFQPGTNINLITSTGPDTSELADTAIKFGLSKFISKVRWSATATLASENSVVLTVGSRPDAPIGLYQLSLEQVSKEVQKVSLAQFVLLFNPWCKRDSVYLPSEAERQEYVLSQDGLIYRGKPKHITTLPWTFGQFEPGILDICLKVLDQNPKHLENPGQNCLDRGSPVYVTRVISAMINSNDDDDGVLVRNWSGDYEDGVKPTAWTDSGAILQQWNRQNCTGVRYGQCWVFAAVACSVSRALGIPCRVVTNYESAHDTNSNLLVERYYNEIDEDISDDSIWNFHVWVESWMTRPDLRLGYEGWQASDPTPQETSEGVHCCGPVSVRAVKEGDLSAKYDTPFVYAEVNADVVEYITLSDKVIKVGGSATQIGQCISTKAVGTDDRVDITHLYKYPEGSEEERQVFEKANHIHRLIQTEEEPGLHVKIKLSPEMMMGSDFDVFAQVVNNTDTPKNCRLMFYAQAVSYNGKLGETCGLTELSEIILDPTEESRGTLSLKYSEYKEVITQDRMIKLVALLIDLDTKELQRATKTIVLEGPSIIILVLGDPKVGQPVLVDVILQNPLPESLGNCVFSLHGANLTDGEAIAKDVGTVGPDELATAQLQFKPTASGTRKLLIVFSSDKLNNIHGYRNIIIEE